ncbi:MAG TPA: NAD-dependent epimerase/dehydratase family protein [Pseudolabrys sp.]|nr:NAD-dependent epimerase/dehydratase family protein [Pseudolabrys sp.]
MKVIVFGGDGFCGWPTALHLSNRGHDVVIVDNLIRRCTDVELGISSLTPITPIATRLSTWKELSGRTIEYFNFDVAEDFYRVLSLFKEHKPDAIVHFAEQRAAPYSMKSERHKRYTVNNNVSATHNILCALVESELDIHVVHLGTMGVYGYGGGAAIPEGYLRVELLNPEGKRVPKDILYPADPGSIYHMTKTLDQLLFYYYNKNDKVRITDLHQGVVWGTNTKETSSDERLINRFDYDGDYGTVLNRFLMQAAIGYPLTVHGKGGQTRAFIHIQDTVRCIELALQNPPKKGDRVDIFNQMTETHKVIDLAEMVSKVTGASIQYLANPRNESPENDLIVEARSLVELGLKPTRLERSLLDEVIHVAKRYADRCDRSRIPCTSTWRKDIEVADPSSPQGVRVLSDVS